MHHIGGVDGFMYIPCVKDLYWWTLDNKKSINDWLWSSICMR